LNQTAPELADVPTAIAALIAECLYKAPEARPRPADFRRRIAAAARSPQSPGLRQLRQIHLEQVEQRAAEFSEMTAAEEREQRRQTLSDSAQQGFIRISDQLRQALSAEVPDVSLVNMSLPGGWAIKLGQATLTVEGVRSEIRVWKPAPPFEVIATSTVTIEQAISRYGYAGRSHALWFGDIQHEGQFLWFEVAFMTSPLLGGPRQREPYALDPGGQAASAIGPGLTSVRLAWPFTPLVPEDLYLSDFIDRWAAWLAGAANGDLQIPSHMPERDPANSWRTS
jgi:eukaryotic-like serine/threonine-protein kinase